MPLYACIVQKPSQQPQLPHPPVVYASPADMGPGVQEGLTPDFVTMFEGANVPFWRPGAAEIATALGWKWLILLPCLFVVIGGPVLVVVMPGVIMHGLSGEIKLWILAIGASITLILTAIKNGVAARKDVFCIHCGYSLESLEENGRCPECGRTYIRSMVDEFRKDPHFFEVRYKKLKTHPPAVAFAAGLGPTPNDGTGRWA